MNGWVGLSVVFTPHLFFYTKESRKNLSAAGVGGCMKTEFSVLEICERPLTEFVYIFLMKSLQLYPEDHQRSRIMGIILGSVALGVLFGYPLGGFLYDFVSESAPFIIIAFFLFTDLAFQLTFFDFSKSEVSR